MIVAGTTTADFDAIDREDFDNGAAFHDVGRPFSNAATAAWRCGWLYAKNRALVRLLFKARHHKPCIANGHLQLRNHLASARHYRARRPA